MICQSCDSPDLELGISLGYLPPCNFFLPIGDTVTAVPTTPHEVFFCTRCGLAQLGYVPPQTETFPASYPYTSSTTRALRDNFAGLYAESQKIQPLVPGDLVIDIGGNDGNLLSHFPAECVRLNVTPEDMGKRGVELGIEHYQAYWSPAVARGTVNAYGKARLITATNVFSHVPRLHDFLDGVLECLAPGGIFVIEFQSLTDLLRGVQFDHVYSEHARYNSLTSIRHQLTAHDLTIIGARSIPTHGGSIRVYAMRKGEAFDEMHLRTGAKFVESRVYESEEAVTLADFATFREKVVQHRRDMQRLIGDIRRLGMTIVGIGAPSRAATLIGYDGLSVDDVICVLEAPGSHKSGHYMPATKIAVYDESAELLKSADFALLLSHHIAPELKPALRAKGFAGKFIVPLPAVRVE